MIFVDGCQINDIYDFGWMNVKEKIYSILMDGGGVFR